MDELGEANRGKRVWTVNTTVCRGDKEQNHLQKIQLDKQKIQRQNKSAAHAVCLASEAGKCRAETQQQWPISTNLQFRLYWNTHFRKTWLLMLKFNLYSLPVEVPYMSSCGGTRGKSSHSRRGKSKGRDWALALELKSSSTSSPPLPLLFFHRHTSSPPLPLPLAAPPPLSWLSQVTSWQGTSWTGHAIKTTVRPCFSTLSSLVLFVFLFFSKDSSLHLSLSFTFSQTRHLISNPRCGW